MHFCLISEILEVIFYKRFESNNSKPNHRVYYCVQNCVYFLEHIHCLVPKHCQVKYEKQYGIDIGSYGFRLDELRIGTIIIFG